MQFCVPLQARVRFFLLAKRLGLVLELELASFHLRLAASLSLKLKLTPELELWAQLRVCVAPVRAWLSCAHKRGYDSATRLRWAESKLKARGRLLGFNRRLACFSLLASQRWAAAQRSKLAPWRRRAFR